MRWLRLAFLGLGTILLSGLLLLSLAVEERLEQARRDREEMVASRVFDEMEREISAFLELEATRPLYTHLENTNPETWAPHVVGYFTLPQPGGIEGARIVAAEGKTTENRRRVLWALRQAESTWHPSQVDESPGALPEATVQKKIPAPTAVPADKERIQATPQVISPQSQKDVTGTEIIESLNRAKERRRAAPKTEDQERPDQFQDYTESY